LRGWLFTLSLPSAFVPLWTSSGCWWLLWDIVLLPHPCCQPLLLYPHSFTESLALRVWLLFPPLFSRSGSFFHLNSIVSVRLLFIIYVFQFFGGWLSLPRICTGLCSQVWVGSCSWCSLIHSADSHKLL
jgi:hypothetical protein